MIGLLFLGAALVWLAFSVFVGLKLPKWLGVSSVAKQRAVTVVALAVLLVGPFVDHIVGMRQFQRLCDEQTRMEFGPGAANAKRARKPMAKTELLDGYVIPIQRQIRKVIDLDTGEQIAQYKYFSTSGGRIGGLVMLGGEYTCAANQKRHFDHARFLAFKAQTQLTYGDKQ